MDAGVEVAGGVVEVVVDTPGGFVEVVEGGRVDVPIGECVLVLDGTGARTVFITVRG